MEALLRLFGNICRFKQGPQDIPASNSLFALFLLSNLVIEIFLGLTFYSPGKSLLLSLMSLVMLLLFTWIWLVVFQLTSRFLQTATAFIGISLFTNIFFFIPLTILWKMGVLIDNSFAFINLILLVWILSIYAHIYKNALNISFFLGIALSITYFVTYSTLSNYLLGV